MAASCCLISLLLILIACGINGVSSGQLSTKFYDKSCPKALTTIKKEVQRAVSNESRMGASLLRLHFHDCFVQGCDASVLLDDTANFTGEKNSFPNANSLRGFELIDNIKSMLEDMCEATVSCADILAVAARDSVVALGGQKWDVEVGRRDSTTASLDGANSELPAPFLNLSGLITAFANKNFSTQELVTLSGGHTIGLVRCRFIRGRIYNESNIDPTFAKEMQAACPLEGDDDKLSPFDTTTAFEFDNSFYKNLVQLKGVIHSDQQLFNGSSGAINDKVRRYSRSMGDFKKDFAEAMLKMSRLTPLTGSQGQIRKNCSRINPS